MLSSRTNGEQTFLPVTARFAFTRLKRSLGRVGGRSLAGEG